MGTADEPSERPMAAQARNEEHRAQDLHRSSSPQRSNSMPATGV
jgi:hypothetical protein